MQYAKDFEMLAKLEEGVFFPTSHSHDNKVSTVSIANKDTPYCTPL